MKIITQSTLVLWLISFVGGIVLFFSPHGLAILFFVALIFLSCCIFYPKLGIIRDYVIFISLFLICGFISIESTFPYKNNLLGEEEIFYQGIVDQQLNDGEHWSSKVVKLQAVHAGEKWMNINEKNLLIVENDSTNIELNDVILFKSKCNEIGLKNNPGEFNAKKYWLSKGIRYQGFCSKEQLIKVGHQELGWFTVLLEDVKAYSTKVLDEWVGKNDAPLIKAILLGDKSDLDGETKRVFMNTGAMHMLAVSGMHVGLIVVLLLWVFKNLFFHRGKKWTMLFLIVLLWFYAFLTGFSASVVRAVAMFTVLIAAQMLKRGYQPINSLSAAAFFILAVDPLAIFDVGFQLSFLAMLGIFTFFPLLEDKLKFKNYILQQGWQGTAIGLASQVFTVPISLYYFNQFPNYFLLTNFAVMLFSGIMLGLAIGLLAIGRLAILSIPVGWFLAICCSMLVGFIAYVEMLPGALATGFAPSWIWVMIAYVYCFAALFWSEKGNWLAILGCLVPLIIWLQIDRLKNISREEMVLFNANFPMIIVNNGQTKLCFYGGGEKQRQQAERMVFDYQKVHTGDVTLYPLSAAVYTMKVNDKPIVIEKKDGWIKLKKGKNNYAFILSDKIDFGQFDSATTLISLRASNHPLISHDLSKGALRLGF